MFSESCSCRAGCPLIVLFEQDGADQACDGIFVGEDADQLGAPHDLSIEPSDRVGAVYFGAMLLWEGPDGQHVPIGIIEQGGQCGQFRANLIGDRAPLDLGGVGVVLGKGGGDEGGDDAPAAFAGMGEGVSPLNLQQLSWITQSVGWNFRLRDKFYYRPTKDRASMLFASASLITPALAEASPLDYFLHSAGPATRPTLYLGWVFAAISIGVCILIAVLLVAAIYRKRGDGDPREIGRGGGGLKWIYIGTGISTVVLFAMMVYMLETLNAIVQPAGPPGLTITVTGYDWWWDAAYVGGDPGLRFSTANEIHIPVGVPVLLNLKSADVIHAFWVPLLAGKTQMIPGQTNRQWIQADRPGMYRGQCTQYCGLEHAHMGFEVIAQTPDEFRKWRDLQLRATSPATGPKAAAGQKIFMDQCSGCHTVRGTDAVGAHAPDLTHLVSRHLIAAALLTNTPENRMSWIAHAQEMKPGARMPDFNLPPADADALSAYLSTLE